MFSYAKIFDSDVSKWDVSSVSSMDYMFLHAVSFKHRLSGDAWVRSQASKVDMFGGSRGSIAWRVSTSTPSRQYVSRRPIPERELIGRTPISTSAGTPAFISAITSTMTTCPKCGTFAKSGRVSCCAPGGAWYKNCGGAVNRNADHSWFEGAQACKRKLKGNDMYMHD